MQRLRDGPKPVPIALFCAALYTLPWSAPSRMDPEHDLSELQRASRRLHDGGERLDALIERLDQGLAQLAVELDYMHPRPLAESVRCDAAGKRIIELSYLCYQLVGNQRRLAVRTIKILESKAALASNQPARIVPLAEAEPELRQAAVDQMSDMLRGLTAQMDRLAQHLEDRCDVANALVRALDDRSDPPSSRITGRRLAAHPSYPQLRRRTEPPLRVTRVGH